MSSRYAEPFARLHECLDELAAVDPTYRTTAEKQEALVGLSRVIARAQAEQQRVLAVADDVAVVTGARSTAAWLADETRDNRGAVRATAQLATTLDTRWTQVADAFRAGQVNLAQVRVIDKALSDLPKDLGDDLLVKAEAYLLAEAASLGPRGLAVLSGRCWSTSRPRSPTRRSTSGCSRPSVTPRRRETRLTVRPRGERFTRHPRSDPQSGRQSAARLPRRLHQPSQQAPGRRRWPTAPTQARARIHRTTGEPPRLASRQGGVATTISVRDRPRHPAGRPRRRRRRGHLHRRPDHGRRSSTPRLPRPASSPTSWAASPPSSTKAARSASTTTTNAQRSTSSSTPAPLSTATSRSPGEIHHPTPWSEGGSTDLTGVRCAPSTTPAPTVRTGERSTTRTVM